MANYPTKDLSQILQILAATSGQNVQPLEHPSPAQPVVPSADPRNRSFAGQQQTAPQQSLRPDPRQIDNLPSARRYVVRHLATDPEFLGRISRMKARQHQHEQQWAAGRRDIQARYESSQRDDNTAKLSGILQSLGGGPVVKTDPLTEAKELAAYDRKVLMRCEEMAKHMAHELRDLGVPLFCGNVKGEEVESWKIEVLDLLDDLADESPAA